MNIKILAVFCVSLSFIACTDRNLEYYEKNISAAEEKTEECNSAFEAAFMASNEKKIRELSENEQCKFAEEAVRAHKRRIEKAKREARQKKLEEEQKAAAIVYEQEYSKDLTAFKALPYSDFVNKNKDCGGFFYGKPSAKCQAYKDLKKDRETAEIRKLKNGYKDGKLEDLSKTVCKGINFDPVMCELSKKAAREQKQDKINFYLGNRQQLKTVFNKCHANYMALHKSKKYTQANKSLRTYECKLVGDAARKLNVWSFNKPIK